MSAATFPHPLSKLQAKELRVKVDLSELTTTTETPTTTGPDIPDIMPITLPCADYSGVTSTFVYVYQQHFPITHGQAWDTCQTLFNGTRLAHITSQKDYDWLVSSHEGLGHNTNCGDFCPVGHKDRCPFALGGFYDGSWRWGDSKDATTGSTLITAWDGVSPYKVSSSTGSWVELVLKGGDPDYARMGLSSDTFCGFVCEVVDQCLPATTTVTSTTTTAAKTTTVTSTTTTAAKTTTTTAAATTTPKAAELTTSVAEGPPDLIPIELDCEGTGVASRFIMVYSQVPVTYVQAWESCRALFNDSRLAYMDSQEDWNLLRGRHEALGMQNNCSDMCPSGLGDCSLVLAARKDATGYGGVYFPVNEIATDGAAAQTSWPGGFNVYETDTLPEPHAPTVFRGSGTDPSYGKIDISDSATSSAFCGYVCEAPDVCAPTSTSTSTTAAATSTTTTAAATSTPKATTAKATTTAAPTTVQAGSTTTGADEGPADLIPIRLDCAGTAAESVFTMVYSQVPVTYAQAWQSCRALFNDSRLAYMDSQEDFDLVLQRHEELGFHTNCSQMCPSGLSDCPLVLAARKNAPSWNGYYLPLHENALSGDLVQDAWGAAGQGLHDRVNALPITDVNTLFRGKEGTGDYGMIGMTETASGDSFCGYICEQPNVCAPTTTTTQTSTTTTAQATTTAREVPTTTVPDVPTTTVPDVSTTPPMAESTLSPVSLENPDLVPITVACDPASGSEFVMAYQSDTLSYAQAWDTCTELLNGSRLAHFHTAQELRHVLDVHQSINYTQGCKDICGVGHKHCPLALGGAWDATAGGDTGFYWLPTKGFPDPTIEDLVATELEPYIAAPGGAGGVYNNPLYLMAAGDVGGSLLLHLDDAQVGETTATFCGFVCERVNVCQATTSTTSTSTTGPTTSTSAKTSTTSTSVKTSTSTKTSTSADTSTTTRDKLLITSSTSTESASTSTAEPTTSGVVVTTTPVPTLEPAPPCYVEGTVSQKGYTDTTSSEQFVLSLTDCANVCDTDLSCLAFHHDSNGVCRTWSESFGDRLGLGGGQRLFHKSGCGSAPVEECWTDGAGGRWIRPGDEDLCANCDPATFHDFYPSHASECHDVCAATPQCLHYKQNNFGRCWLQRDVGVDLQWSAKEEYPKAGMRGCQSTTTGPTRLTTTAQPDPTTAVTTTPHDETTSQLATAPLSSTVKPAPTTAVPTSAKDATTAPWAETTALPRVTTAGLADTTQHFRETTVLVDQTTAALEGHTTPHGEGATTEMAAEQSTARRVITTAKVIDETTARLQASTAGRVKVTSAPAVPVAETSLNVVITNPPPTTERLDVEASTWASDSPDMVPVTLGCGGVVTSDFVYVYQRLPLSTVQAWATCRALFNGSRLAHLASQAVYDHLLQNHEAAGFQSQCADLCPVGHGTCPLVVGGRASGTPGAYSAWSWVEEDGSGRSAEAAWPGGGAAAWTDLASTQAGDDAMLTLGAGAANYGKLSPAASQSTFCGFVCELPGTCATTSTSTSTTTSTTSTTTAKTTSTAAKASTTTTEDVSTASQTTRSTSTGPPRTQTSAKSTAAQTTGRRRTTSTAASDLAGTTASPDSATTTIAADTSTATQSRERETTGTETTVDGVATTDAVGGVSTTDRRLMASSKSSSTSEIAASSTSPIAPSSSALTTGSTDGGMETSSTAGSSSTEGDVTETSTSVTMARDDTTDTPPTESSTVTPEAGTESTSSTQSDEQQSTSVSTSRAETTQSTKQDATTTAKHGTSSETEDTTTLAQITTKDGTVVTVDRTGLTTTKIPTSTGGPAEEPKSTKEAPVMSTTEDNVKETTKMSKPTKPAKPTKEPKKTKPVKEKTTTAEAETSSATTIRPTGAPQSMTVDPDSSVVLRPSQLGKGRSSLDKQQEYFEEGDEAKWFYRETGAPFVTEAPGTEAPFVPAPRPPGAPPAPEPMDQDEMAEVLELDQPDSNAMSRLAAAADSAPYILAQLSEEQLRELGYTAKEMFDYCAFDGVPCDMTKDIAEFFTVSSGNCFTFNHNEWWVHAQERAGTKYGLHIILNVGSSQYLDTSDSAGVKVFVHNPYQSVFPDAEGFTAPMGYSVEFGTTFTQIHRMEAPYGDCVPRHSPPKPYYYEGNYTTEGCIRSCFQAAVIENCGCGDPQRPVPNGTYHCGLGLRHCVNHFTEHANIGRILNDCDCNNPCYDEFFTLTPSQAVTAAAAKKYFNDKVEIKVFFERLGHISYVESPEYPFSSLLSDMGGNVGIWLSASVISLFELAILALRLMGRF